MDDSSVTRLAVEPTDDGQAFRLVGDIDSHTAPTLEAVLVELDPDRDVALDLAAVGFIDSSGLRVLVAGHQRFEGSDSRLVLRSPSAAVLRLLEIAGLSAELHVEPEVS